MLRQFISPVNAPAPEIVAQTLAQQPGFIWFDSARAGAAGNHYSYLAANPLAQCHVPAVNFGDDPLGAARQLWAQWRSQINIHSSPPIPFMGGLAGLISYDVGQAYEKLPKAAEGLGLPVLQMGIYPTVLGYDHESQQAYLAVCAADEVDAAAQREAFMAQFSRPIAARRSNPPVSLSFIQSQSEIESAIAQVIAYITAGDIFQANVTTPLRATVRGYDLFTSYLRLRRDNAAPYAAFMQGTSWALASCSPEQFISLRAGQVTTRPIKGTAPSHEPDEILTQCPKNRAENIMIVDLLRNDISRVCTAESVDVPQLCVLEHFSGLKHLVSTVTGELRPECDAFDLLRACMPGGSITGAPKIRAMEIINDLEVMARRAYCGALAYVSWQGDMDSNILIRTLVQAGDELVLQVGGGIVADSLPDAEYAEFVLKASRIVQSLQVETLEAAA